MTHLHVIQTSMSVYALDSDGNLPPFAFAPVSGTTCDQSSFEASLAPDGVTHATWFCPADAHGGTHAKGLWTEYSQSSYGMPPSTAAKGKASEAGAFVLAMPTDASTVLLCDQPFLSDSQPQSAHGKLANAAFGDGHSKAVAVSQLR